MKESRSDKKQSTDLERRSKIYKHVGYVSENKVGVLEVDHHDAATDVDGKS